jgi:hypothetical protein
MDLDLEMILITPGHSRHLAQARYIMMNSSDVLEVIKILEDLMQNTGQLRGITIKY